MKKLLTFIMFVWLLKGNGQTTLWSQLGSSNPVIYNMTTMFADTVDNLLYIGGRFEYIDGKKCRGAAKWNGISWDSLASGFEKNSPTNFTNDVKRILRYKNKIYYFGTFLAAGNYTNSGMAVWNGSDWEATQFFPLGGEVYDADIFNDTLYICGSFSKVGNVDTWYAARYDGANWYPMNFPYQIGPITSIRAFKNKVYALGTWYSNGYSLTAEWTHANGWQPSFGVQGDNSKWVSGLERIDSLLFFYGHFTHISTMYSPNIVAWSGSHLYGFGQGIGDQSAYSLVRKVRKVGNKIYAVGVFNSVNGLQYPVNLGVTELDGNTWCVYGQHFDNDVLDITKYNNERVICGPFKTINGDSIKMVAKWIGGNYTYSCSTFTIAVSGINETKQEVSASLFPIPFKDQLTIKLQENSKNFLNYKIVNLMGQKISEGKIDQNEYLINTESFQTGLYIIYISDQSGKVHTQKIIKSN